MRVGSAPMAPIPTPDLVLAKACPSPILEDGSESLMKLVGW
jgi:hypothetical protein